MEKNIENSYDSAHNNQASSMSILEPLQLTEEIYSSEGNDIQQRKKDIIIDPDMKVFF